jgi:hypothetical protein
VRQWLHSRRCGIQGFSEVMSDGTSKTETGRKPAYFLEVLERARGMVEVRVARDLQVRARAIWEGAQRRVVKIRARISEGSWRRADDWERGLVVRSCSKGLGG